jgi:hypothetical protein
MIMKTRTVFKVNYHTKRILYDNRRAPRAESPWPFPLQPSVFNLFLSAQCTVRRVPVINFRHFSSL